jgi:deoxycytidine triphosphate deaminase
MVTVPLGWSTKQAPSDTIVVLSGTQGLLSRGVFCPSVTVHQSRFGAEITVPLVNFTNYPIQIENGVLEKKAFRLGPNGK